jgi:hypothetical protein
LIGNTVKCPVCKERTGCNKDNMRFVAGDEGFVGDSTV